MSSFQITLFVAIGTLLVMIFVKSSFGRELSTIPQLPAKSAALKLDATPDKPTGFGYKIAWIVIKSDDPREVAQSLKLLEIQPANWRTGLATAYEHYDTHVFITPSIEGKVFVVGAIPDPGDSEHPDECTSLLEELGKIFDPVFYFGTHRVVGFHAWARIDKGKISRAYAFDGDQGITIWDKGEQTSEEKKLGFKFFADVPPQGQEQGYRERKDLRFPDEEDVMSIAEAWTLNPTKIDQMNLPESVGLVGKASFSWK